MTDNTPAVRTVPTNTGNPRITVAFPFSKIEIADSGQPALADLARVVLELAEHLAAMTRELAPEQADVVDRIVAEARDIAGVRVDTD